MKNEHFKAFRKNKSILLEEIHDRLQNYIFILAKKHRNKAKDHKHLASFPSKKRKKQEASGQKHDALEQRQA